MKKTMLFAAALLIAGAAFAQPYARLHLGYAIGLAGQNLTLEQDDDMIMPVNGSLGAGINATGTFGAMVSDFVGIELGVSYLHGQAIIANDDVDDLTGETRIFTRQVRVIPSLLLKPNAEGVVPFARFGAIVPVVGRTTIRTEIENDNSFQESLVIEEKTSGRFSVGFQGAFGLSFSSGPASVFAEVVVQSLAIRSNRGEVVEYEREFSSGESIDLDDLETIQIETEYLDEIDIDEELDEDDPNQALSTPSPFSSLGLNFGVTFTLGE